MAPYLQITRTDRHHRSVVQTPITPFCHLDTGRRIVVVSTAHFGEGGYYQALLGAITASMNQGFTVHYENANHQRPDDQPSTAEQTVLADLATMRDLEALRMSALGWTHQPTVLHHPNWQRHDLTDLEIVRQVGTEAMRRYIIRRTRSLTWPDHETWRLAWHQAIFAVGNRVSIRVPPPEAARTAHINPLTRVLLHTRTQIAVTAATATTDDLIMIWGARHLPGITTALSAAGYRPDYDHQRWPIVGYLPPIRANTARYLLRRPPTPHPCYYTNDRNHPQPC
ncbi:hypothetical protein EDC02_4439 [Micromonospora sp. Llam0]|uniref:hypothetical protein n=1 Tax=Micromonospora sp. Llam0 TaxID=2485143 RepID=UPI000F465517|nr:hypothetical protein [Micromonospora sp. Llam0]ROO62459.1 hypothetical protein EDC02_4439 [Micromonospora sp. Llam0]